MVPFDLTSFGLAEMLQLGRGLRLAAAGAPSLRSAAETTTRLLYRDFVDPRSGAPACALVRFYKTHSYRGLPADDQAFARNLLGSGAPSPELKCLTMLASAGDEPRWNSPRDSRGHRAIPLPSVQMVESAPMIAALIKQFGLTIESVVSPPKMADSLVGKTYNVFHVPTANGSTAIPAQAEFVIPYRIQSVLGFGGVLRTGDLFAVIMFSKVPIPEDTASRFRNIALEVKTLLFNFEEGQIF